jgi:hypothetical protein
MLREIFSERYIKNPKIVGDMKARYWATSRKENALR